MRELAFSTVLKLCYIKFFKYLIGKNMNIKKIENICAAALIVAFFLPWVSMGFLSFSGYQIASTLGGAATLMFLLPLLAIAVLVNDSQNFLDADKSKYLTYTTAGIPILYILSRVVAMDNFFSAASIGIYLTLIVSIVMILGALGKIKLPE